MADQQTYHDAGGNARLIAYLDRMEGLILRSEVDLPDRVPTVVAVPTAKLLAMIDALDPDAMRAYLRETTSPEAITINVHAVEPDAADLARKVERALAAREQLDAIPEADSTEDVTESRVDRRYCDPLTEEELEQLRASGRTIGEAWRTFTDAVREGRFGADR